MPDQVPLAVCTGDELFAELHRLTPMMTAAAARGEREGDRLLEAHLGACCVRLAPVPRAEARGCEELLVELRVYVGIADRADRGRCTEQPCGALGIAATSCDCRQAAQALGGDVLSGRAPGTAEAARRTRPAPGPDHR